MGSRLYLKVDLQKAFDTVNKELLYYMFHYMGFSYRWINWIKECLSSASFSILNGSPTEIFKSNRGIRQGDPLPLYLFVLIMKFWSITMDIALVSGSIKLLRRNDSMMVSHLLFADDMLVYCKRDKKSASV